MRVPNNKTYTFMMSEENSPDSVMLTKSTGWEGLQPCELLNMFRLFLLEIGFSEDVPKTIQDIRLLDVVVPEEELQLVRFDHLR